MVSAGSCDSVFANSEFAGTLYDITIVNKDTRPSEPEDNRPFTMQDPGQGLVTLITYKDMEV